MNKLNILIVDDDAINRMLIKAMLSHNAEIVNSITEATNGAEALDIVANNQDINLILLDIIMPVLDGKGFLKRFRSQNKNSNIPVIILTTDDSQKSEILNHGADDVLIKPIKEDELIKHIKYWTQEDSKEM
jgi:putative two-component system response regulator